MTIWFYIHTIAKRAKAIALIDLGAMENFINLTYTKWLKLPIHPLEQPRKIFNVNGTENKAANPSTTQTSKYKWEPQEARSASFSPI